MDNSESLRRILLEEKEFVLRLYGAPTLRTATNALYHATDAQLNLIVKLVAEVAGGRVPIALKDIARIKSKKKLKKADSIFAKPENVKRLLAEPPQHREERLKALTSVAAAFRPLLEPIVSKWSASGEEPLGGERGYAEPAPPSGPDSSRKPVVRIHAAKDPLEAPDHEHPAAAAEAPDTHTQAPSS